MPPRCASALGLAEVPYIAMSKRGFSFHFQTARAAIACSHTNKLKFSCPAKPNNRAMKATKKKSPLASIPPRGCAFQPAMPAPSLAPKKDDGSNAPQIQEFLTICALLNNHYPSFDFRDVIGLTRGLDLQIQTLDAMFHAWVSRQIKLGKLQEVCGCYESSTYRWV